MALPVGPPLRTQPFLLKDGKPLDFSEPWKKWFVGLYEQDLGFTFDGRTWTSGNHEPSATTGGGIGGSGAVPARPAIFGPHPFSSTTGNYDPAFYGQVAIHEYMTLFDQVTNRQMLGFFVDKHFTILATGEDRHRIVSTRYDASVALLPISMEIGDQGTAPSLYIAGTGSNLGNVGLFTTAPRFEFTLNKTKAGQTVHMVCSNKDNANSASDARFYVAVGLDNTSGASAGDPYIFFNVFNVTGWTIGIDNSDADKLKFDYTTGVTNNPGTNTVMTLSASKYVGIGSASPETYLHIQGDNVSARGLLYVTGNTGQPGFIVVNAEASQNTGLILSTAGSPAWQITRIAGSTDLRFLNQAAGAYRAILAATGDWTIDANFIFKSGTSFSGTFDHAITADRTWTFQNVTGTIYQTAGQDVAIADGGTNSSTALNNGRVMISSGGAIVERAALTAAALVVGDATNGIAALALGAANRIVGMNAGATANEYKDVLGTANQITVTHAANSITLALPQSIHTAGTPQFARMGLGAAADAAHLLLLNGGTVTVDTHLLDALQTWNAGGVTFTALKLNITDTASAAASLLLDLQVAAASKFKVKKDGSVTIAGDLDHDGSNVGFFGVAPAARPSAYTQTYATADKTHAAFTSADLTGITSSTTGSALAEPSAAYTQSEMQQNFRRIQDQFNALRADVADAKQLINSVIDDLQSLGIAA